METRVWMLMNLVRFNKAPFCEWSWQLVDNKGTFRTEIIRGKYEGEEEGWRFGVVKRAHG